MSDKRILICCEDQRSKTALAREFGAYLHVSQSSIDYAPTAEEAYIALERGETDLLILVSEAESDKERYGMEQLAIAADCPTCFVNLRPNYVTDASLQAPACTVYLGPQARVDQVRKAIRHYVAHGKKQERGGWR